MTLLRRHLTNPSHPAVTLGPMRRTWLLLLALLAGGLTTAGPAATPVSAAGPTPPPLEAPGDISRIVLVETKTVDGWRYESYRNPTYACAYRGFHTFTIATRVGTPADAVRPLWTHMHGGGVGYFNAAGEPVPGTGQMTEEEPGLQRGQVPTGVLQEALAEDPAGFRFLTLSMCSHDIYSGTGLADPNNPRRRPDGKARTVDGLLAAKAAVRYAVTTRPTDDLFLHGGSAGSFGAFGVAWALQRQGLAPAGIVTDSGVLNRGWEEAQVGDATPCGRSTEAGEIVPQRLHPDIVDPANQPDRLVASGRLTVPVWDVFSTADAGQCGATPMSCPLPDGTTVTLGSVECLHEPLRLAIAAQGPTSRSASMGLCVTTAGRPACGTHTPTKKGGVTNTDPDWPADFQTPIVAWVHDRLADDHGPSNPKTATESFVAAARTDFLGDADPALVEAGALAVTASGRTAYLDRLVTSDPWLEAVVDGLYQDTLGRPGDASGTAYWVGALRSGRTTVAGAAAEFYASNEYYAGLGGGTPETWVADLYAKILGRPADAAGLGYWTDVAARSGRGVVALRFYQSPESARTRVIALYDTLLGRAPDAAGLAYWAGRVVVDGDLALATSLAGSPEYLARSATRFP